MNDVTDCVQGEAHHNTCISTCIVRCEKGIYPTSRMESETGVDIVDSSSDLPTSFETACAAREIGLEDILIHHKNHQHKFTTETDIENTNLPIESLTPTDYLSSIEPYMPEALISPQNYAEIKNLADYFTSSLTSFFGFESRLSKSDARSDYLFAVSSRKGEREVLANFIESGKLPETYCNRPEWQQLVNFVTSWADPNSILYDKVLGLWFEFDTSDLSSKTPIPNIFLQVKKLRIDTQEDVQKFLWITRTAIPMLIGQSLSENIEKRLIHVVKQLPEGTSLIHVGTMLSRTISGIHIVINRIKPKQIIPYLQSIGWSDETEGLSNLLNELENYVSRIILHLNIGDEIDPKIGLECSFSQDKYHQETGWFDFLNYLVEKGLCLPEKKSALLSFLGVEQEDPTYDFNLKTYMVAPKIPDNSYSGALVRYISHVKIVYKPNHLLEAKAYPGVRLFGLPRNSIHE